MKEKLKNLDHFSLTADIWIETMTNTGYLGLTVGPLFATEWLQSMIIGVFELDDSHTGDYIRHELTGILRSWNIDTEKRFRYKFCV